MKLRNLFSVWGILHYSQNIHVSNLLSRFIINIIHYLLLPSHRLKFIAIFFQWFTRKFITHIINQGKIHTAINKSNYIYQKQHWTY